MELRNKYRLQDFFLVLAYLPAVKNPILNLFLGLLAPVILLPSHSYGEAKSIYIEREQKSNSALKQNNFNSHKIGANYWSDHAAIWGSVEVLEASELQIDRGRKNKVFGELAGEKKLGNWVLAPGLARGSDARYRADSSYQMQIRYVGMESWWPYLSTVREQYETTATSTYLYQRAGSMLVFPYSGVVVNFYLQTIDLEADTALGKTERQGNGQLLGVNYFGEKLTLALTGQRNCVSDSYQCNGRLRDFYRELALKTEYRLSPKWSAGAALGLIEQQAENRDLPLANLTSDAQYLRFLIRYHL